MMQYILYVNLSIVLLYATYVVFVKKLTFFEMNRFSLLLIPLISFFLPFLKFQKIESVSSQIVLATFYSQAETSTANEALSQFNYFEIIAYIYLIISGIMFVNLMFKFNKLYKLLRADERRIESSFIVSMGSGNYSSFSFFNRLYIGENDLDQIYQIVEHENLHRVYGHSIDNLYFEVLNCLFWFNPVIKFMHKEIRKVHEYEVDEALSRNNSKDNYMRELAMANVYSKEMMLTNPYKSNSNLINRLRMMNKNRSLKRKMLNYIAFVPVLSIALFLLACSEEMTTKPEDNTSIEERDIFPPDRMNELTVKPEYNGGMQEMYSYMQENIIYPEEAKSEGLSGKVFVSFVISESGEIVDVKVVRGIHPLLDAEAKRAVENMPDWIPAELNGEKVAVSMMLPIQFTFDQNNSSYNRVKSRIIEQTNFSRYLPKGENC